MFITCKCILFILSGYSSVHSVHSIHKDISCQRPQIHVYQSPSLIYHPSVTHTSVISLDHLAVLCVCLSSLPFICACLDFYTWREWGSINCEASNSLPC